MNLPTLFAQVSDNPTTWIALGALLLLAVGFMMVLVIAKCVKGCPPNRILVIYGKTGVGANGNEAKTVHGGAAFVMPLIQDYAYLNLEPMEFEAPLPAWLGSEEAAANVPTIFTVAIGTDPEVTTNAAIRLLGLNAPEIRKAAQEVVVTQRKLVIGAMGAEEIRRDEDPLRQHLRQALEPELNKVGLTLLNMRSSTAELSRNRSEYSLNRSLTGSA